VFNVEFDALVSRGGNPPINNAVIVLFSKHFCVDTTVSASRSLTTNANHGNLCCSRSLALNIAPYVFLVSILTKKNRISVTSTTGSSCLFMTTRKVLFQFSLNSMMSPHQIARFRAPQSQRWWVRISFQPRIPYCFLGYSKDIIQDLGGYDETSRVFRLFEQQSSATTSCGGIESPSRQSKRPPTRQ